MQNTIETAYLGHETSSKEQLATSMSSTVAESIASFAPDIARDKKAVLHKRLKMAALALFAALAIAVTIGVFTRNNARVEKGPATRLIEKHSTTEKAIPEKIDVSNQTKSAEEKTKPPNRATLSTPSQDLETPSPTNEVISLSAEKSKKVGDNTAASPRSSVRRPKKKRSAKQAKNRLDGDGDKTRDALKHSIKGRFGTRIVEEF